MDNRRFKRKKQLNKPLALVLVSVMLVSTMLGTAFGWRDFTQNITNRFRGSGDADATLHDEFDGVNKHVFVENSGMSTIYVRVRLDEYMQVAEKVFSSTADAKNKTTWSVHTYDNPKHSSDRDKLMIDCGHADVDQFHRYYTWKMSGQEREYTPGVPGMVYTLLGEDIEGKPIVESLDPEYSSTHITSETNPPILMSEFLALGVDFESFDGDPGLSGDDLELWESINKGCWVLDDTKPADEGGGWAYWSMPLLPDTATNLLLEEVTLRKEADGDWIYRIDVKLQATTLTDTERWHDEDVYAPEGYLLTTGARKLIDMWNKFDNL